MHETRADRGAAGEMHACMREQSKCLAVMHRWPPPSEPGWKLLYIAINLRPLTHADLPSCCRLILPFDKIFQNFFLVGVTLQLSRNLCQCVPSTTFGKAR